MDNVKPLHEVMTKEEMSRLISEYAQVIEGYRIEYEELKEGIERLKEKSEEEHYEGTTFRGTMDNLAEWYFGYSEGIDYAIEKIESILK